MQYFLNGGRNERGVLKSAEAQALYARLGIKRLLVIPYAIMEDHWQQLWHDQPDMFKLPELEVRALTALDTDEAFIAEQVAWAEFMYLPGGAQKTLLRRLRELGTDVQLRNKVEQGQLKLLGGGSAGAMVMGSKCIVGRHKIESVVEGLGYLTGFVIDSHFSNRDREPRLLSVLKAEPTLRGMGLDEDTAVVLDENLALQAVYGAGRVSVYNQDKKEVYDSTSHFPT